MRTFQNIRKRLKGVNQRQKLFSNLTVHAFQNDSGQIIEHNRFAF